ncbi:MAG: lamin tail domain-containing protein [Anaerolineales bacterium]|nr:MAG: lamin tail domain-containing protein [Anaerolineales bacterium]
MKQSKRLLYYLLINILVSACTTVAVLVIWDRTQAPVSLFARRTPELAVVSAPTSTGEADQIQATLPPVEPVRTPTATQVQNVEAYEVLFGDTLGLIAEKFDVSIQELLDVNQIPDPNSLPVGMVLYIPVTPEVVPTSNSLPTSTSASTLPVTPSGPQREAGVVINGVIGAGNLESERVFLTRTGDGELSLAGWQLRDEDGNVFVFPQLILFKDGGINIWTTSGSPTVVDLYWGMTAPVWDSGERVELQDAQGRKKAEFTVP